jgi:serine/threonine protein kinase/Flp pilus assembly protein TadD
MTQRIRSGAIETFVEERTAKEAECRRLAADVIARWERGEPADTRAVLATHPEVVRHPSVVLDLAYEEYCQRISAGESIDTDSFCARFPDYASQISRLLEVHGFLAQHQRPPAESDWPSPGELCSGFLIREELGRGAIARVYLAQEPALGDRLVAIKVSPHGQNEAETLGKLSHPNIVPVFSVKEDEDSGWTAVCMPYLGRATLADITAAVVASESPPRSARVIRKTLDARNAGAPEALDTSGGSTKNENFDGAYIDAVVRFGCQLADGLALTHAKGILHRDLKPSNVLVTPAGVPKLLDFNLSADAQAHASRVGGTLPYMSPEQIRQVFSPADSRCPIDPRSDIFSLGVILYELLTGRLPFGPAADETSPVAAMLLLAQQERGCQPVRLRNRLVDARLAAVIERCLAPDPQNRPQSAAELAKLLQAAVGRTRRLRRWAMAYPRRAAAISAVIATCGMAIATIVAMRDPYCVRQYDAGRAKYEQAEYRESLRHFQNAVDDSPSFVEARFALARARQQLDEHSSAAAELSHIFRETSDRKVAAGLAYSLACQGLHSSAIHWGQRAIDAGWDTAVMYNNLGISSRKHDPINEQRARHYFTEAIKRRPDMQSALYNLALITWNSSRLRKQAVPASALDHIKRAVEVGPDCAEVFRLAALLQLMVRAEDRQNIDAALEYLIKAVALGLDIAHIRDDKLFEPLVSHPRMALILRNSHSVKTAAPVAVFLDPLAGEPLPSLDR